MSNYAYNPTYNPGGSQPYAQQYAPPAGYPPNNGYGGDHKDPYDGGRFKPKKKINDPIFLVLFIAQVCVLLEWTRTMCWETRRDTAVASAR